MNEQGNQANSDAQARQGEGFISGFTISGGQAIGIGLRQNARNVIRDRIGQLRNEACRLEALLDALPAKLPPDADQALWDLAISARRG